MDALDSFTGTFSSYLTRNAVNNRMPISGTFELLPFCNMRCKMCYIVHENEMEYQKQMKGIDFWDKVIDQAIEEGMLYALITGGEPFLYPQIRELLERINKKPIHLAINTNATLLDEKTVEWLSKVYPGKLNISLYGGSNETYQRLCGNPKGFDQVTRAFRLLNQYKIPYCVHSTITPDNICDFDKMIEVCNNYKAPFKMVDYMFPPYRKDHGIITNDARFEPEQAAEVAFRILKSQNKDRLMELWRRLEVHCACFEEPHRYGLYGSNKIACRGGYASFWINWRGQISGCGINDIEKIDLTQFSFANAWKDIVASTESIELSEKCQFCKYRCICPVCAAAAFCETGDVGGTPEYLCRYSERYAELLKKELEILRLKYE